jgi:hypothetical protein
MMLTCRYSADIISSVLPRRDLTWKVSCIAIRNMCYAEAWISC